MLTLSFFDSTILNYRIEVDRCPDNMFYTVVYVELVTVIYVLADTSIS